MNQKIKDHVVEYNRSKGYGESDDEIIEVIREAKVIWTGNKQSHRWWNENFTVVEVNGMKIGFWGATTTGDDTPEEKGWEFDPDTICEVAERTKTITYYEPV